MSSFNTPHRLYCFKLKNGKRKLAYGASPEDALEILSYRLTEEEMSQILRDDFKRIAQTDLHKYIDNLG